MEEKVSQTQIVDWFEKIAETIEENKDYLTELDAAIGDADHGINMDRGFKKAIAQLLQNRNSDIGTLLKTIAMTLISSVGGASGPLYGTLFLRASSAVAGKQDLTAQDLANLLQAGKDGVIQRGKANLGDKTMLDALSPAVETYTTAIDQNRSLVDALREAVLATEEGMKNTIPLVAKKGRASYLGERSAGHQDPGATSTYLILRCLLEVLEKERSKNV
ncbi:dihydroxyacetone kinase subunit DhaL [Oxynema aestuarii]|uniref:Dihydroxyacetone kinase subunit L n=1 Tax=Oxynema aestuarii AP17 TaxID=2064643 RepID=A0A6H1U2R6_9CYAN|nr:dihydroxyacetone kinase subunit DhaL [Oxynema aestuarii]QIZ73162.1 dihydroxyacetone kinase subunit L [Oxynema aestuarii AP17]